MIKFYGINDAVVRQLYAEDVVPYEDEEEYYLIGASQTKVYNSNYDATSSKNAILKRLSIREKRNNLLVTTDVTQIRDSLNNSGNLLTAAQKTIIDDWRQELRDLPGVILANNCTDTSFPTTPTCMPNWLITACDDIASA